MAKIKDIAGGFFNNDTIYSPNGFTQARKVSDAIIDRTISDMSDEISQGMNFGAQHKRKKGDKASIAELTGNKDKIITKVSPLPSKEEVAARQQNTGTKKETLINPDTVSSGATAKPVNTAAPGTKEDPTAVRGLRADEPAPKPNLPQARPGLYEDQSKARETLTNKRSERDEFIESTRQDKRNTKRSIREKSIIHDDDFDLFDEDFSSTDPVIASFFSKGKINKLLKDQIKEKYPEQIAEITDRIKNDPDNADLSGREIRKLINKAVTDFIEPLWREEGGDIKVDKLKIVTPVAAAIKKNIEGTANESSKRLLNDKRAATEKKQNKSLEDILFLSAFDLIEKDKSNTETIAKLKGEVKDARSNLTNVNAEVRGHEKAVERALNEFNKGGVEVKVTHKNGWDFYSKTGDGRAQYAAHVENKDGKKKYVMYSVTAGSPDTYYDPVKEFDYEEYSGENNPNEHNAKEFTEGNIKQVVGGTQKQREAQREAQKKKDFETLDGQNFFDYRETHSIMAPKVLKTILDLGGKIDAKTGKIYSTSVADFPEGASQMYLDYKTALRLAGKSDEDVAKLTGMTPEEVKVRRLIGMTRGFKLGDKNVTEDEQGRLVYQLPTENITVLDGKNGRRFYINWNNPFNRKVVAEYAKRGIDKKHIPEHELKTVNLSRSTEGNIDWSDTSKTKAAEREQKAKYTGSFKPSADILDALIGFGNKSK